MTVGEFSWMFSFQVFSLYLRTHYRMTFINLLLQKGMFYIFLFSFFFFSKQENLLTPPREKFKLLEREFIPSPVNFLGTTISSQALHTHRWKSIWGRTKEKLHWSKWVVSFFGSGGGGRFFVLRCGGFGVLARWRRVDIVRERSWRRQLENIIKKGSLYCTHGEILPSPLSWVPVFYILIALVLKDLLPLGCY